MSDLRAELSELLDEAEWDWLMPHAQRDAVVLVNPDLDLLDVGVAIASDQVDAVQGWIANGQIGKPSADQLSEWAGDRTKRFNALIVQPFVLIQNLV